VESTRRRYRASLLLFVAGLLVSGLTAGPLLAELRLLCAWLGVPAGAGAAGLGGLRFWLVTVREGLERTYAAYPWVAYGTDWLAFAHVAIAVFFVGPYLEPARNRWVLQAGLACCALVVPTALIAGALRGIPLYWRLLDCSFGVFGSVPLLYCLMLSYEL
jgi:hypothetical protein